MLCGNLGIFVILSLPLSPFLPPSLPLPPSFPPPSPLPHLPFSLPPSLPLLCVSHLLSINPFISQAEEGHKLCFTQVERWNANYLHASTQPCIPRHFPLLIISSKIHLLVQDFIPPACSRHAVKKHRNWVLSEEKRILIATTNFFIY